MQACFFRSPEKSIQKPDTTASWTSSPHYISWRWHKSRLINKRSLLLCCFMFTEARRLIRDGDGGGRGQKNEGSTSDTAWKRPERPWTAARTMEVLRRCPLAIAQRLVHYTTAVSTAVFGQSQRQCPLHCCWRTTRSERSPTFIAQLHLPTHDLLWAILKV